MQTTSNSIIADALHAVEKIAQVTSVKELSPQQLNFLQTIVDLYGHDIFETDQGTLMAAIEAQVNDPETTCICEEDYMSVYDAVGHSDYAFVQLAQELYNKNHNL